MVIPIMEFDLTIAEDRKALAEVFELEYEQIISIKGSPQYMVIRGGRSPANKSFRWDIMKKSCLVLSESRYDDKVFLKPNSIIMATHEEFFDSLQPDQKKEFIFFLDHLI